MSLVADSTVAKQARRTEHRRTWSERGSSVIILRLLVIVLVVVLWQLLSGSVLPEYAVSKPTAIWAAIRDYLGSAAGWTDIRVTSIEVVLGYVIGVALGTVAGLVLGSIAILGKVLEPLIAAINGIPKIALAPLFLLFFGIGMPSKIALATMGVSFVVFYNIYLGLRLREQELVQIVQVMGGQKHHVLGYVTIPTLASPFFAGLKTGGPFAILGVIGGEFVASANGVGHQLFISATNLDAASLFSGLIVLVVMTLMLNSILSALDRLALKKLGLAPRNTKGATV